MFSGIVELVYGFQQFDFMGGLFMLEFEYLGIFDDVQNGGMFSGLMQYLEDQVLEQGRERFCLSFFLLCYVGNEQLDLRKKQDSLLCYFG